MDLISFQANPQREFIDDPNSHEMKYMLVLNDHLSRLAYMKPLPRKEARRVAKELHHILALIGYPLVFQTDNEKGPWVGRNYLI